jgi:hypothetical protein
LTLKYDILVSKFAFEWFQLVPLRRGNTDAGNIKLDIVSAVGLYKLNAVDPSRLKGPGCNS